MSDELTSHIDELSGRAFEQADRSIRNAAALGRITNVVVGLHVLAALIFAIAALGSLSEDAAAGASLLLMAVGILVYAFVVWAFLSAIRNLVGNGGSSLELQAFEFATRWADDEDD